MLDTDSAIADDEEDAGRFDWGAGVPVVARFLPTSDEVRG